MDTDTKEFEITAAVDFGDETPATAVTPAPTAPAPVPAKREAFLIGEYVTCANFTFDPAKLGTFGVVVYRHGKHSQRAPRVRWASGVGTTENAKALRLLTPAECQLIQPITLCDVDHAAPKQTPAEAQEAADAADRQAEECEPATETTGDDPPAPMPADWPESARTNREAWLTEAARRVVKNPADLANVLFSVGYGRGGTRGERTCSVMENENGKGRQVFVRPTIHESVDALMAVYDAASMLGVKIRKPVDGEGKSWPAYPQPEAHTEVKTQATRLLKCTCDKCGFTFRSTSKWIDRAEDVGRMRCVNLSCAGTVLREPAD